MDIYCSIMVNGGAVAEVIMTPVHFHGRSLADFNVIIKIDRGPSVGHYRRTIYNWPYRNLNPVLLLGEALSLINPDMATIEGETADAHVPPDLARGLGGTVQEVRQEERGELCDHGPTVRSGQPVEHGEDGSGQGVRPEDSQRRVTGGSHLGFQLSDGRTPPMYGHGR